MRIFSSFAGQNPQRRAVTGRGAVGPEVAKNTSRSAIRPSHQSKQNDFLFLYPQYNTVSNPVAIPENDNFSALVV
jgi:hypothetical protein